jgi:hypothetical protein
MTTIIRWGMAVLALATPCAAQVAIAPPAIAALREAWKSNAAYACLYGHAEGTVVVIDSADVRTIAAPDSVICRGPYVGVTGFYRSFVGALEESWALNQLTALLDARPDWWLAGLVHGIVPTFDADGTRVIAPLMWRATRAIHPAKQL